MLKNIRIEINEPIVIYCDNTSTINISKNLVLYSKTKHISIKYHMLREKVVEKEIRLEYVRKKEKIADIFTKPLPKETFKYLRNMLGVILKAEIVGRLERLLEDWFDDDMLHS